MFWERVFENYDLYKDELKFGVKSFCKEIVWDFFFILKSFVEGEDICNEEWNIVYVVFLCCIIFYVEFRNGKWRNMGFSI